jgi:hypothetical protein
LNSKLKSEARDKTRKVSSDGHASLEIAKRSGRTVCQFTGDSQPANTRNLPSDGQVDESTEGGAVRFSSYASYILSATLLGAMAVAPAVADDQTLPGAGNADAAALAKKSPMVRSAYSFLQSQAGRIKDDKLRKETLDALGNPDTCIQHRKNLTDAQKVTIV